MPIKKSKIVKKPNQVQQEISWEAPDFIYYKKNNNWYIVIAVTGIVLLIIFYFIKLYAAMALIFASVLALFSLAKKKPEQVQYILSAKGINFKEKNYAFSELKSFCIINSYGTFKLLLEQNGKFKPTLEINIEKINPNLIRNFLLNKLPENDKLVHNLNETISNIVRF